MKKILLTLLLVVGGFVAQAQDITVKIVTNNNSDRIAIGSNGSNLCFDNVTVIQTSVYSWNNTSGELRLNGDLLQTYAGLTKLGTNNFFNSYSDTMYATHAFLSVVLGEVAFSSDESGQYSINN